MLRQTRIPSLRESEWDLQEKGVRLEALLDAELTWNAKRKALRKRLDEAKSCWCWRGVHGMLTGLFFNRTWTRLERICVELRKSRWSLLNRTRKTLRSFNDNINRKSSRSTTKVTSTIIRAKITMNCGILLAC